MQINVSSQKTQNVATINFEWRFEIIDGSKKTFVLKEFEKTNQKNFKKNFERTVKELLNSEVTLGKKLKDF